MATVSGVVLGIFSKDVTTKFGKKHVWDLKLDDGNFYKHGFKKPPVEVGESITIEYDVGKYGSEIKKLSSGAVTPTQGGDDKPSTSAPVSYQNKYNKPFPVPADSGERAIIRQNSLTNARELVVGIIQHGVADNKEFTWPTRQAQYEVLANEIIRIAYMFEEYSSGDREVKAVDALQNKSQVKPSKKTPKVVEEDTIEPL